MGDLGDIFDLFSQDNDKKQRKGQEAESEGQPTETSLQSQVINKLVKNKALLVGALFAGVLLVGAAGYFLICYIGDNGVKGILDVIKPFIGN
jgi:hypothetical protein